MKNKTAYRLLILLFAAVLVLSAVQVFRQLYEYHQGAASYEELREYVEMPEDLGGDADSGGSKEDPLSPAGTQPEGKTSNIIWPAVDFDALREINADIVGWLHLEDSAISYPVVQSGDNTYYMTHLFDGTYNSSGSLFLDYRNGADLSDRHSVIYGHHMKNGAMFAELSSYKNQAYYDEHPVILLLTPDADYEVWLYSGYVSDVNGSAWQMDFDSEGVFAEWLEETAGRSCFISCITPVATDRILTLSTCSYEFTNARFVLHGVLRERG